jgi:crotonyl-CoA reductase
MTTEIAAIREAILRGATGEEIGALPIPKTVRGALVKADEQEMFAGVESADKDPRKSIHVEEFALPELAPDEAFVGVMASAINFNTVWTSIFEPLPTFGFLKRLGRESVWGKRHDQPFHVIGSDACGVVLQVGSAVRNWKPGDVVTAHCLHVDDQDPSAHDDTMMATNQRIWGFETNFGGLAEVAVLKANQLMPKPAHLTWEEAACNALCNSTSYRMIVSKNGSQMTQGQGVLVWGATGGIGAYATQYVINGGGTPVGVVSSEKRAELLRAMGCEAVIDRRAEDYKFWNSDDTEQDPAEWLRFGKKIRSLIGRDVDIVFEHPGRSTMGASVFVAKRGGMIITCAATSGFKIEYDNRYLWMNLKTLKGCHFANYREAWEANRLVCDARIHPTMSKVFPLDQTGDAALQVHHNLVEGKVSVLCLAPEEGLGVTDAATRERHLDQITLFRRFADA